MDILEGVVKDGEGAVCEREFLDDRAELKDECACDEHATDDRAGIDLAAFLGLEIGTSSQGFQTTQGVEIVGTASGTPAANAGLGQGDVVTALDGKSVSTGTNITEILVGHHPGDKVSIAWTDTSGQSHTATLTLGTGPSA